RGIGNLYWKMFFTVLFRNPKSIEAAVNLAAMFIHFQKQKTYVVSQMKTMIQEIESEGETAFYERMLKNTVKRKVVEEIG
ncbi:MAG TPA: DUF4070 domain-containing protein, partial [Bacteroidales bacterium]